ARTGEPETAVDGVVPGQDHPTAAAYGLDQLVPLPVSGDDTGSVVGALTIPEFVHARVGDAVDRGKPTAARADRAAERHRPAGGTSPVMKSCSRNRAASSKRASPPRSRPRTARTWTSKS